LNDVGHDITAKAAGIGDAGPELSGCGFVTRSWAGVMPLA
jgi:hypothetical protein